MAQGAYASEWDSNRSGKMQLGHGMAVLSGIMGEIPTPREAIGLTKLARQFRASARDTTQKDYVRLFLSAALALEARARGGHTDPNFDRHLYPR
jgi:hypothetical protein